MWSPDHTYTTFNLSDLVTSVSDNCDTNLGISSVVIVKVTSDEPDDANADGSTINDIVIANNCKSVQLRAERKGDGNGRVYIVTMRVTDSEGNVSTATAKVTVPHAQNGNPAVDSGVSFTVLSNCP
jgi:Ca-activated chloride channel family protein